MYVMLYGILNVVSIATLHNVPRGIQLYAYCTPITMLRRPRDNGDNNVKCPCMLKRVSTLIFCSRQSIQQRAYRYEGFHTILHNSMSSSGVSGVLAPGFRIPVKMEFVKLRCFCHLQFEFSRSMAIDELVKIL